MTTEELDALDALLRERDLATEDWHRWREATAKCEASDYLAATEARHQAEIRMEAAEFNANKAGAKHFKVLLAQARQAATLRAKLIESETWRTELRQEADAVKGRLREVTGQRDELRVAAEEFFNCVPVICEDARTNECRLQQRTGQCEKCNAEERLSAALESYR